MNQTFAYALQFIGAVIGILTVVGLIYWAYLIIFKDYLNLNKDKTQPKKEREG